MMLYWSYLPLESVLSMVLIQDDCSAALDAVFLYVSEADIDWTI